MMVEDRLAALELLCSEEVERREMLSSLTARQRLVFLLRVDPLPAVNTLVVGYELITSLCRILGRPATATALRQSLRAALLRLRIEHSTLKDDLTHCPLRRVAEPPLRRRTRSGRMPRVQKPMQCTSCAPTCLLQQKRLAQNHKTGFARSLPPTRSNPSTPGSVKQHDNGNTSQPNKQPSKSCTPQPRKNDQDAKTSQEKSPTGNTSSIS